MVYPDVNVVCGGRFLFNYILATNGGVISTISQALGGNIDLLGHPKRALFAVMGVSAGRVFHFIWCFFLASFSGIFHRGV